MSQFTYRFPPGTPPWQDGSSPGGDAISENLYFPVDTADLSGAPPLGGSLDVLNGQIDQSNMPPGQVVQRSKVRKQTFSGGGAVGSTANLDFFKNLWMGDSLATMQVEKSDSDLKGSYIPIPGAAVSFYLPYTADVLVMWNIGWFNDGSAGELLNLETPTDFVQIVGGSLGRFNVSQIQLFHDNGFGVLQNNSNKRKCPPGYNNLTNQSYLASKDNGRFWCGHKLIKNLVKGPHTAGLRIFAPFTTKTENLDLQTAGHRDGVVQQTRVRVRSMRYLWFR